jgi:hypothetical protein
MAFDKTFGLQIAKAVAHDEWRPHLAWSPKTTPFRGSDAFAGK